MNNVTVENILRGCEVGRIQTVGFMQVIPLVSDIEFDNYAAPMPNQVNNPGYTQLDYDNSRSDQEMLIPAHLAVISKQRAQDHAMTHAAIVAKKKRAKFSSAVCVQQSQGGHIRAAEDNRLIVLPVPLREAANKMQNGTELGRLWPSIGSFLSESGVTRGSSDLVAFLEAFDKQLDEFVAEFEPVPNQVGAIVLVNGAVVGVERAPNYDYWKNVWKMLIRECYGSLAILEAKKSPDGPKPPKTRVELKPTKGRTLQQKLDSLEGALEDARRTEYDRVKKLVGGICQTSLPMNDGQGYQGSGRKVKIKTVGGSDTDRFLGQVVFEGEAVLYASLVSTQHYQENEEWLSAEPFAM